MKKSAALLLVCTALLLAGCNGKPAVDQSITNGNSTPAASTSASQADGKVIEIKEKMFVTQTNEIYLNAKDYLGKTLKYEGYLTVYNEPQTNAKYYAVVRNGPGCCGPDANPGFEVSWNKDYPKEDDWLEVVGVLEQYEENGEQYLRVKLDSLKVLETRGAEYVNQ
ncbi:MAG: hypothetical protein LBJ12_01605 [Oscillospiraceae bacterium]|jgi:uncharacterized membrane protein YcgQ (UPF0703/DUF1980 family)|nr:hypothetical protein [Oscillospiraceae bacterium]